ncbi:MAG: IS110 family transposase [Sporichthyaceae bacterium]
MDVLIDRVAGLDVGKATVTVCIRTPGPKGSRVSETRTYSTMTRHLQVMAEWLVENGVTLAAMESTATYWKPVFYCLEERLETWLLNAAHIKAVPGRKSDVRDAEWIARLVEHGLVSPSFVPPPEIRRLRNLTRYRVQLMGDRTREATRVEKLLEDASIKLSVVVSNITGASARAMLTALVEGQTDPHAMADLAYSNLRNKKPALAESLIGRFDDHHRLLVGGMLQRLAQIEASLKATDAHIAAAITPWQHEFELLQTIPGVGVKTAQVFIAETGADMGQFHSPSHLAAWAGLAPAVHESAGKSWSMGTRRGNKWLASMLVESAHSAARMKNTYLAAQYRQLAARRGAKRAAVAVAHSMLVSGYWMLVRDEPYRDLGPDWFTREIDPAVRTRRLVAQLERLGHSVTLEQAG